MRRTVAAAALLLAGAGASAQAAGVGPGCLEEVDAAAGSLGELYTVVSLCRGRERADGIKERFFTTIDRLGLVEDQYRDVLTRYYLSVGLLFERHPTCDDSALDAADLALDAHLAALERVDAACSSVAVP